MHSTEPKVLTPLSKSMLDTLEKVCDHEKCNLPPLDAGITRSSKGLLLRGMVSIKLYFNESNKKIMALFITERGKAYLNTLKKV